MTDPLVSKASDIEATFRGAPGLYIIGSLERGVTIYNQQLRAHNLCWALFQLRRAGKRKLEKIAIVGGGIAGLTAAACFLSLLSDEDQISISLFEQSWDLCPLQQGADVRWVHPNIYKWPSPGSRAPSASIPVLNWAEGRASDVARTVLREFAGFHAAFANKSRDVSIYLGLKHFQIDQTRLRISWVGHQTIRSGEFFHLGRSEGAASEFDTIIIAAGFGMETRVPEFPTEPYWRNEQLGQPQVDGMQRRLLVSGYGDGALVDLCRLTVERFRQDTIVYELFEKDLDRVERHFYDALNRVGSGANMFNLFQDNEITILGRAKEHLAARLRKDTQIFLHLNGRNNEATNFAYIFGPFSSFLHRLMTYLLYRCGAFGLDFGELNSAVERRGIDSNNVLCRYGANSMSHLGSLFIEPDGLKARFQEMKEQKLQTPERLWPAGVFKHYL